MDDLDRIRQEINASDDEVLRALATRRELAGRIIAQKANEQLALRDPRREEEILERLISKGRELGLDAHFVTRVFHEIIDDSVRLQQLYLLRTSNSVYGGFKKVAFQGIEGAYSFLAAQKFFARELELTTLIGYPTFQEVVEAVEKGTVNVGFLPIENTTAGSINEVSDLLAQSSLSIIGEEVFRVEHCLVATEEVPLASVRRVYSHPQALAQCMKFLATLNCERVPYPDTAMAARKVKEDQDPTQGAIASEAAARQYGLKILKRDCADQQENYTRFLVVAREPHRVDPRIPAKTSLVLAVPHEEGALLKAIVVLHSHKINMTKLDGSRPRPGAPFQYLFNIDFEGNIAEANVRAALDELRGATAFLKILGSYPLEARTKTPPSTRVMADARTAAPKPDAGAASPAAAQAGESRAVEPSREKAAKLASRGRKAEPTVINVRGVKIGGGELVVFAGPYTVESREQILACARHVRECGGRILRGGCFRPSTSPDGFHGLGFEGVDLLAEAGRQYDLPILTEVLSPGDVETVARSADILQVGSRNMQNYGLLREVGRVNRPVLIKRGVSATIDELLAAAEYILSHGNQEVILCERGIRTLDSLSRDTLDLSAVPVLRQLTHLPIVVDPSRAAGRPELVRPLALAAQAVGCHGLLLELHPDPEKALGDASSSLRFPEFAGLLKALYA